MGSTLWEIDHGIIDTMAPGVKQPGRLVFSSKV
jgi:hypothetical protein